MFAFSVKQSFIWTKNTHTLFTPDVKSYGDTELVMDVILGYSKIQDGGQPPL